MSKLLQDARDLQTLVEDLSSRALSRQVDANVLAELRSLVREVRSLLEAFDEPVRVGVVGAFSSGKTRLIEALLGCAGRLNVGESPSTGNIVEFQLSRGDGAQTRVGQRRVVLMDERTDASPLVVRLLSKARGLIDSEQQVRSETRQLLDEALRDGMPSWSVCQRWASQAHAECQGNELKSLAFEVYRLAYTIGQARAWLGKSFGLTEAQAVELMSLTYKPDEVYKTRLDSWRAEVPEPPEGGSLPDLNDPQLRALFPIVAKLEFQVELPAHVVNALGPSALKMRLVDCPGAGADASSYRDEVLCAAELSNVDTVLVLLSGKSPGQKRGFLDGLLQAWGETAKDRILAVVSRFDLFPHNQDSTQGKLAELASSEEPLTAVQVLATFSSLRVLLDAARDTVMDRNCQRIVFVSAMGYLTSRLYVEGKAGWGLSRFYRDEMEFDPETAHEAAIREAIQRPRPWLEQMKLWHAVGQRLTKSPDDESQRLAELLRAFAEDGGFSRMLQILETHLNQHGRKNQLQRLEKKLVKCERRAGSLRSQLDSAPERSEQRPASVGTQPADYGAAIRSLRMAYERLQSEMQRATYPLVRVKGGEIAPIADLLRRNLVHRIFRWKEWGLLFGRLERDGTLRLVDPEDPDVARFDSRLKKEVQTPTHSEAFFEPFAATLNWCESIIAQHQANSFQHYLEDLKDSLELHLGGRASAAALAESLDEHQQEWLTVGPADYAETLVSDDSDPLGPVDSASFFPLQRAPTFHYAWHAALHRKYPAQFANRHRHLMYVIRLRQTLVDSAIAWMEARLSERGGVLSETIRDRVDQIVEQLNQVVVEPPQGSPVDDGLIDD